MWNRFWTICLWFARDRRVEFLSAQIELLKTRLLAVEGDLNDMRLILDEKREEVKRLKDDLAYCERERGRLYRENHELLAENRVLRMAKGAV